MGPIIKYVLAAALSFAVFKLITLIGEIGTIDTTGQAPVWLTVLAAIIALAIFGWCASKISKNS